MLSHPHTVHTRTRHWVTVKVACLAMFHGIHAASHTKHVSCCCVTMDASVFINLAVAPVPSTVKVSNSSKVVSFNQSSLLLAAVAVPAVVAAVVAVVVEVAAADVGAAEAMTRSFDSMIVGFCMNRLWRPTKPTPQTKPRDRTPHHRLDLPNCHTFSLC